ncbi:hypothetical protein, partial [Pseudomonas sp. BDAL1]|uniref:hypothetical protein n=1 Tax=Pseudomonas sp. BDAL1 TaxID=1884210 RepID=UPI002580A850
YVDPAYAAESNSNYWACAQWGSPCSQLRDGFLRLGCLMHPYVYLWMPFPAIPAFSVNAPGTENPLHEGRIASKAGPAAESGTNHVSSIGRCFIRL